MIRVLARGGIEIECDLPEEAVAVARALGAGGESTRRPPSARESSDRDEASQRPALSPEPGASQSLAECRTCPGVKKLAARRAS